MYEVKQVFNFITFQIINELQPNVDLKCQIIDTYLYSLWPVFGFVCSTADFCFYIKVSTELSLSDPIVIPSLFTLSNIIMTVLIQVVFQMDFRVTL